MVRALFMGQTGLAKKSQLDSLAELCARQGHTIDKVFSVGDIMYSESQTAGKPLQEGKILDLPLAELGILRRLAFTHIRLESSRADHVMVGSHSVFRWNNQLFRAFEFLFWFPLRSYVVSRPSAGCCLSLGLLIDTRPPWCYHLPVPRRHDLLTTPALH